MAKEIQRLGYQPDASYGLDLEVFSVADLRQRGKEQVRMTHRYGFHALVCVTRGHCTQMVDFKFIACRPGSLIVLRAGQAHNYGHDEDWDGWNVLFRPEFALAASTPLQDFRLAPDLDGLHEHMLLSSEDLQKVTGLVEQLREDTLIEAPREAVHALLRHQLHALFARLSILQGGRAAAGSRVTPASQRFKRFQHLVEERFSQWHQVADYARHLGYTEKSLARAVTASMGMTAKAFIAARIVLEAKRLLVHTDLPVATIGNRLGFDEPTNFGKFFRREAHCTPVEFRRRQGTGDSM